MVIHINCAFCLFCQQYPCVKIVYHIPETVCVHLFLQMCMHVHKVLKVLVHNMHETWDHSLKVTETLVSNSSTLVNVFSRHWTPGTPILLGPRVHTICFYLYVCIDCILCQSVSYENLWVWGYIHMLICIQCLNTAYLCILVSMCVPGWGCRC